MPRRIPVNKHEFTSKNNQEKEAAQANHQIKKLIATTTEGVSL